MNEKRSTAHREKVCAKMLNKSARDAKMPKKCQLCGSHRTRENQLDYFRKKWMCGACLTRDEVSLTIDDYVYDTKSTFGRSDEDA